jgi:hypothetical protein
MMAAGDGGDRNLVSLKIRSFAVIKQWCCGASCEKRRAGRRNHGDGRGINVKKMAEGRSAAKAM